MFSLWKNKGKCNKSVTEILEEGKIDLVVTLVT